MTKESPKIHSTWLILRREADFKPFFAGLCEYLKQNLGKQRVEGSYEYHTCGHEHCSLDPKWEPFKYLRIYCWKAKFDFYQVKDFIELHLGRNIICECQILTDEKELKRMRLQMAFGMDFGEEGDGRGLRNGEFEESECVSTRLLLHEMAHMHRDFARKSECKYRRGTIKSPAFEEYESCS